MELIIRNRKGLEFICLYDDCDHKLLDEFTWHLNQEEKPYARTRIMLGNRKHKYIYMHRLILNIVDKDVMADHANRNRLDNRRCNLRTCTPSQNVCNKTAWGSSKYLGVTLHPPLNKWVAQIRVNKQHKYLGIFVNEIEAAHAYDAAAIIYHGEFANLNFK